MEAHRTLIIDLAVGYGGSSSRVLGLLRGLSNKNVALAGLDHSAVVLEAKNAGLPVYTLGSNKADPRILYRLIHLIQSNGFQVLDTQNIQSKFWASLAAMATNTALISTINSWYVSEHGQSSIKSRIKGRIYTTLELLTNWGLDLYITVSEKDRQTLLQSKISQDAIELIYNAIEVDPAKISGDFDWLRQKFDLPPQTLVCTAVGRLVPVKGYDVLIEAVQRITTQIPEFICLIVGEGECKEALIHQIQKAGLEGNVRLVGFQNREIVLSILKSSDIFAMPSRYEGTPIALLEAAALGCPIIATSSGGIPELVTNDVHALLVRPNDSIALAEGLLRLSTDRKYAKALGQNAQLKIKKDFDINVQVQNTWDAYQKAWDRHNKKG